MAGTQGGSSALTGMGEKAIMDTRRFLKKTREGTIGKDFPGGPEEGQRVAN